MKRLMVLSLVLVAAASASAALSLVPLGGGQVGISLDPAQNKVYFLASDLSLTRLGYELTDNAGGDSEVVDYGISFDWAASPFNLTEVGTAATLEIISQGIGGQPVLPGIQFIATFDLPEGYFFATEPLDGGPAGRVDLITVSPTVLQGTLYVVPEPMTLGLLAGGALMLRRRR